MMCHPEHAATGDFSNLVDGLSLQAFDSTQNIPRVGSIVVLTTKQKDSHQLEAQSDGTLTTGDLAVGYGRPD